MTQISQSVSLDRQGRIAVVTVNNPPVNALSHHVRQGLRDAINQAAGDAGAAAIVIACAGRTFIAGADITEFGKPPQEPTLSQVQDVIERSPKPIVAAIHGTALGGGLELAMTCHWRVAVKTARLGQPEVKLGLIPGGGGTQRLPRLVGVDKALAMIVGGDPIGGEEAKRLGLVDEIVDGDLTAGAIAFAERVVNEKRPLRKVRDLGDKVAAARGKPEIFSEFRKSVARQTRGFKAPEACIRAVEAAVSLPFDQGLARERELFIETLNSPESKAQRYFFFAEREAAKIPDVPAETPAAEIRKAAVIGAGTMGGGIAMNFANVGIPVTVIEVAREALDRGLGVVRKNYEATAAKGRLTKDDVEKRMGLIQGTTDFNALADADLVVEAVFEEMPIKKDVFARLDKVAKASAVLATNTSTLDVDEIAAATRRPESVVGMHFFSPANVMRLLEVVRGEKSAKPAIATAMAIGRRINKVPVLVVRAPAARGRVAPAGGQGADGLRPAHGPVRHGRSRRPRRRLAHPQGPGRARARRRSSLRDGPFRPEDGQRLLQVRRRRSHAEARSRGRPDHRGSLARGRRAAPIDLGRRDPRAPALPHGQRRRQDPRGGQGDPCERHRRHLGVRLRLARLSRRPDVLGRPDRAQDDPRPAAGVREADRQ